MKQTTTNRKATTMPATLTLSRPADDRNAKSYTAVKDRCTVFGGGLADDKAMLYVEAALLFVGDEVGHMVTTTEVAYSATVGEHKMGQHHALSALAVLSSWGFLANLGLNAGGRYIYARTTKPVRSLDLARHESWLRTIQARDRQARERA